MNFRVHEEAYAELIGAAASYEAAREGLGEAFTDRVLEAFTQFSKHPRRFGKLEFTQVQGEVRRYLLQPKFPHVIVYEVHSDLIEVLAVAHGSREPDYWASRNKA